MGIGVFVEGRLASSLLSASWTRKAQCWPVSRCPAGGLGHAARGAARSFQPFPKLPLQRGAYLGAVPPMHGLQKVLGLGPPWTPKWIVLNLGLPPLLSLTGPEGSWAGLDGEASVLSSPCVQHTLRQKVACTWNGRWARGDASHSPASLSLSFPHALALVAGGDVSCKAVGPQSPFALVAVCVSYV